MKRLICRVTVTSVAIFLAAAFERSSAAPIDDPQFTLQQERQQQVRAETDTLVRRLGTMLRVLDYYQIDKAGERKIIEEMTGTLAGLSRNQMNEVIRRLESAVKASDLTKAAGEVRAAYERHREILDSLKALLARHDAVRSLDQAADLLEKLAKDQLELHLATSRLIKDSVDLTIATLPSPRRELLNKRRGAGLEPKRQADVQSEIFQDTARVIQQIHELRASLPAEQKGRVERMRQLADKHRVVDNLRDAAHKLKANASPAQQVGVWQAVNGVQWQAAGQLNEMARALRAAAERLTALREARERIERLLTQQNELAKETNDKLKSLAPALPPADPKAALARAVQDSQAAEKAQELSNEQAHIENETKDTANLVKPHVGAVAGRIEQAEQAMHIARAELTKSQPSKAVPAQEQAAKALQTARAELDKLLAAADKQSNDPYTALKNAAADLDKLIHDQTDARDQTKNAKEPARVAALAKSQKELAARAKQLKDTPLPATDDSKVLLSDAAKAMSGAAKALDKNHTDDAVPKQNEALKALEAARKDIGAKVAELAKRQDAMAKLQEAAAKLGELANAEKAVAERADALDAKLAAPGLKDLAKHQENLTPQAKDIAKSLASAVPEAAKDVSAAAEDMAGAKKALDQSHAGAAASQAEQAARKLTSARRQVVKAVADINAKNLADQAALQPNKIDPEATAQLIAKALEQTDNAQRRANEAAAFAEHEKQIASDVPERRPVQKAAPDLARLQGNIAKQADAMDLPEAATDAGKAAQALQRGAIENAVEKQESALAKLQNASKKPTPRPKYAAPTSELKAPHGVLKSFEPKNGQPPVAESKADPLEPAENKATPKKSDVKTGEAKSGNVKAGQQPAAVKANQTVASETKVAQTKGVTVRPQKAGEVKAGSPKSGEPPMAQAKKGKAGDPKIPAAKATPSSKSAAANPGQVKDGSAQVGVAKTGAAMQGEAKMAHARPGISKAGEGTQALAKAGEPSTAPGENGQPEEAQAKADDSPDLPQAKNVAELARTQQKVMDATKALTQSQEATGAAMAALGQAQAQAPQGVQKQLESAGRQLAKAGQNLHKGRPAQAGASQARAAQDLSAALKAMNAALAAMDQPTAQPGQPATAQAKADFPGEPSDEGAADEPVGQPKQGQAANPGQANGKTAGPGQEKNDSTGTGDHSAEHKLGNPKARLTSAGGDGSFLHLPPRQRELIRQALSGQLPPEYAAMIQQYYMNIARGRAGVGAVPPNR